MNLKHILLSVNGRVGRRSFWLGLIALNGFAFVAAFLISFTLAAARAPEPSAVSTPLVTLASIYPTACLYAKRLHDLNRSGWWQLLAWIPMVVGFGVLGAGLSAGEITAEASQMAGGATLALSLVLGVGLFVYCGFFPASGGPNRFGPPEGQAVDAAAEVFS